MHQSRRGLPTSHSFRGLPRVRVPRCNFRPGGLRHARIENNELGHWLWHDYSVGSCQRQAVSLFFRFGWRFLTLLRSTILLTFIYEGLLIGFWFIDHA